MIYRASLRLALFFMLLASGLFAQVKASLVAAGGSVKAGGTVVVALKLVHDAHWHTYWKNPGTGLPTEIKWTLPEGWTASAIEWPVPKTLHGQDGSVVGNGYEGTLYLPITLTAPANLVPGAVVELKAKATWLMCRESCVPGQANLKLSLPVSAGEPEASPVLAAIRAQAFPTTDALPGTSAYAKNASALLLVVKGAKPKTGDTHFFSDSEIVDFERPQSLQAKTGFWELDLPLVVDTKLAPERIKGVLAFTDEQGVYRGQAIDLPVLPIAKRVEPIVLAGSAPLGASASLQVPAAKTATLLGTLFTAFIGGLILNLMPCVFPVLGIKILGFVNQAGSERRKVVMHGVAFSVGVLLSFWTLAGLLAVLRAGGSQLGWGFQLQSPVFVFGLAAVMLVFAMNMSGVFEFGLGATSVGSGLQMKTGYSGSFFTGILATVVATPCSAPFLAPALGAALAMPVHESFFVFTAIALGLCMPYLLLSIFPQAIKILPRPGLWMETFKQFMAFPLYATVAYLAWVLAGQTGDEGFFNVLMGLVCIALAAWIYGRWTAPGRKPRARAIAMLLTTLVAMAGIWVGYPASPSASKQSSASLPAITWEKWSPQLLEKYRSEGREVYVDFTARWCATCQANKKLVFHSEEVLAELAARKVVTLRADWTNSDPEITAELARWNRSAVPFNLVYLPGKSDPVLLPELLTPQIVLKALKGE